LYGGGATGESQGSFRMRGVPGVATYIDGVWQATTDGLLTLGVVEVDRIEVLRGLKARCSARMPSAAPFNT
jgi:hypothetical protein